MMEALEIMNNRRSIRSYTEQEPSKDQIAQIIQVAQAAPNAGPFFITVIRDKALLNEIDEALYQSMINSEGFGKERASLPGYRPLYGAPVCVVFSAPESSPLGPINTACACTAGAYAAASLDLGSCFIMGPKRAYSLVDKLGEKLKLPEDYRPECGLLIGYTDDCQLYRNSVSQVEAVYV